MDGQLFLGVSKLVFWVSCKETRGVAEVGSEAMLEGGQASVGGLLKVGLRRGWGWIRLGKEGGEQSRGTNVIPAGNEKAD